MNGPSWQPAQQVLDDYRIDRTIGMGGMGQVYLCTSMSTGSRFAVKKSLVAGPEGRRRFLSELAIWFGLPEYRHFARCQLNHR